MKAKLLIIVALVSLALSGCATNVAKVAPTQSGKPEVEISSKDVDRIKAVIIGSMIDAKFSVSRDSSYLLVFTAGVTAGQDFALAMTVGNAYSTNSRVVAFTFVPTDSGTRIVVSNQLQAQLPGGQVNALSMDDNGAVFNEYHQFLQQVKKKIETPPTS